MSRRDLDVGTQQANLGRDLGADSSGSSGIVLAWAGAAGFAAALAVLAAVPSGAGAAVVLMTGIMARVYGEAFPSRRDLFPSASAVSSIATPSRSCECPITIPCGVPHKASLRLGLKIELL